MLRLEKLSCGYGAIRAVEDLSIDVPAGSVLALVAEGRRLFSDLTVDDNLTVGGYCRSMARDAINRAQAYELFPILRDRRTQLAGSLSGGEQQMLAMGRALMAEPRLLLIDELSLGLMPKMVDLCFDALAALKADGVTILLVEQNTARAVLTDRVLEDGYVAVRSGIVERVGNGPAPQAAERQDFGSSYVLPGAI